MRNSSVVSRIEGCWRHFKFVGLHDSFTGPIVSTTMKAFYLAQWKEGMNCLFFLCLLNLFQGQFKSEPEKCDRHVRVILSDPD